MSWLDRVEARARRGTYRARHGGAVPKGFAMPPFWSDGAAISLGTGSWSGDEPGAVDYIGAANTLFKGNGIVFSCVAARMRVFSQARLAWARYVDGRASGMYYTPDLAVFRRPWPGGTMGEFLGRMEIDGSLAGNSFWVPADASGRLGSAARADDGRFLSWLRPDWVRIFVDAPSGDPNGPDARVIGYGYRTPRRFGDPWVFTPAEVCHFSPIPDPDARYRGMSWLTPVLRSISADNAMTEHTTRFLRQGAAPAFVAKVPADVEETEFDTWVAKFREMYEGVENAGKTIFMGGGADITTLTYSFKELDMGAMQSKVEVRIAMAAGVHPSILAAQAGLEGSALNAGNFEASRRIYVDANIRGLWDTAAASAERLVTVPDGASQLAVDDRDVPFLRDSAKEEADVLAVGATTMRQLIEAGFDADAAVQAWQARDLGRLAGTHTGLVSVQLQKPGTGQDETTT